MYALFIYTFGNLIKSYKLLKTDLKKSMTGKKKRERERERDILRFENDNHFLS